MKLQTETPTVMHAKLLLVVNGNEEKTNCIIQATKMNVAIFRYLLDITVTSFHLISLDNDSISF